MLIDNSRVVAKIEKVRVDMKRDMDNYKHSMINKVINTVLKEINTLLPKEEKSSEQLEIKEN